MYGQHEAFAKQLSCDNENELAKGQNFRSAA